MLRRRSERLEEFLGKLDANGDGAIDADEATGGQKLVLERMLGAAGVEVKYPLSIRQVRKALLKNYQSQIPAGRSTRAGEAAAGGESRTGPAKPPMSGPVRSIDGLTAEEMLRRRSKRLEEFLRKMDANANGMIDASEVRGGQKLILDRMVSAAGMEGQYPLSIRKVHEALMKSYQSLVPAGGSDRAGEPPPPPIDESRAGQSLRERSERLEEFLRKLDANANGMIDADEVAGGQKLFLERMIGAAGMEVKYPLSIHQVREALMKSYQSQ
jgi:Ca2+-binding EF-hand superfamily protein